MIEKPSIETHQTTTSSSEFHYESQKVEEFEKNSAASYHSHNIDDVEENNIQSGTHRGLDARHIQMISLGGAIGTGLFLNSGSNVANAGPVGALIAYCIVGFMVYCIMTCLGEMATFMP
ncbi:hypothetical protein CU098_002547, partial [Rhizopus stolonifer]